MEQLNKHEVWEEILFGNVNQYSFIVEHFADMAEHLATPDIKPHACEVVRAILDGNGPVNAYYSDSVGESLVRNAFRKSHDRTGYSFRDWLEHEMINLVGDCPDELVEEVVEYVPDDVPTPTELPVKWPDSVNP